MACRIFVRALIAVVLGGALAFGLFRNQQGQEFAGSSFDGESPQDASRVFQDLESYLLAHGFSRDGAVPAISQSGEGDRELYFHGRTSNTRNVMIRIGLQNTTIHTGICWEIEGFSWQVRRARLRAFGTAAGIDDCLAHRTERNLVPADEVEERRRRFRSEIARNTK